MNACCQASHEIQCFLFAFAQLELQYKGNSIEDAYHIFVVVLGFHYDNRVLVCKWTHKEEGSWCLICSSIHMLRIIVFCVTQTEQQSCVTTALLTDSGCGLFIYDFIF